MKRKRVIMERLVELEKADPSFDLEFWRRIGPQGRFSAAWEMVKEVELIRGKDVTQSGLRRSVQNIERI